MAKHRYVEDWAKQENQFFCSFLNEAVWPRKVKDHDIPTQLGHVTQRCWDHIGFDEVLCNNDLAVILIGRVNFKTADCDEENKFCHEWFQSQVAGVNHLVFHTAPFGFGICKVNHPGGFGKGFVSNGNQILKNGTFCRVSGDEMIWEYCCNGYDGGESNDQEGTWWCGGDGMVCCFCSCGCSCGSP